MFLILTVGKTWAIARKYQLFFRKEVEESDEKDEVTVQRRRKDLGVSLRLSSLPGGQTASQLN